MTPPSESVDTVMAPEPEPLSHQERWHKHRSSVNLTDAPTPAPLPDDDPADDQSNSQQPSSASTPRPLTGGGVDADDEDVKIAIMALGSMKNLDGSSSPSSSSKQQQQQQQPLHRQHPHLSLEKSPTRTFSNSSVTSTAMSSPSSTPATDLTQDSGAESPGGSRGSSAARKHATLADLPPDFTFPAILQDEQGNQVTVNSRDDAFLKRVSHLPIVRGTLRAYEIGKQRSRVVKYGADFVESSVKTISRPVVSRLGASLGERGVEQLDDFACRQLDRIYPPTPTKQDKREVEQMEKNEWQNMSAEERERRKRAYLTLKVEEREREMVAAQLRQRKGKARDSSADSHAQSDGYDAEPDADLQDYDNGKNKAAVSVSHHYAPNALVRSGSAPGQSTGSGSGSDAQRPNLPASRSGSLWGSMLVEAGATAGGLSAAMSEESMKSLKYCLQWLQYATAHIEHQITVLRDLIVKLNHGELDVSHTNLAGIKSDVVTTIRGVVDVVGKYAGNALPEPARNSVKAFILSLPARWATANRPNPNLAGSGSPASPSFSAAHALSRPPAPAAAEAANKILTLAVESLDILRSVTIVFGESLDRADLWVERLRILGLQRKRQHAPEREITSRASSPGADSDASMATTASSKRRRVLTHSRLSDDETETEREHRRRTPRAHS